MSYSRALLGSTVSEDQNTANLPAGTLIDDRYRIVGELGAGGMGRLYRAEHTGIRRPVALKVMHTQLRGVDQYNERMIREAIATGRVDHRNCVAITDCGTLPDGAPYLVMELLDGRSLGDELDERGTIPVGLSIHIIRQVLLGLEHAHRAGVVHRDLKPENIFLVSDDDDPYFVKLLDFGIAKLIGDASADDSSNHLTAAGTAIGSPTYMAPEQAIGDPVDGRTDLYSVSVVLYEMLSGQPPFDDDEPLERLRRRITEEAPPIKAPPSGPIPAALAQIVTQGLRRNPAERIQTAREYREALDRVAGTALEAPAQPSVASAAAPQALAAHPLPAGAAPLSSRRVWIGLGASMALVVLIAVVASLDGDEAAGVGAKRDDQPSLELDPEIIDTQQDDARRALDQELDDIESEIEAGQGERVRRRLVTLRTRWPTSARVHYLQGLAFLQVRYWSDGFDSLRQAIALDPSLRADDRLIRASLASLSSRSKPGLGVRFLVDDIGEAAIPYLEVTARDGGMRQREWAQKALDELREP